MTNLPLASTFLQSESFIYVLYIIAFGLFIQGLRGLSGPTGAVRGNRIAAVGMGIAVVATLLDPNEGNWGLIALGIALGVAVGVPAARQVKMTAMPQMVALFNGVGGGAVAIIAWVEFRNHGSTYGSHLAVRTFESGPFVEHAIVHTGALPTYVAIFSVFAAIVGSVSFLGSNIAFGSSRKSSQGDRSRSAQLSRSSTSCSDPRPRGRHRPCLRGALRTAVRRHADRGCATRQRRGPADRRGGHAGRDLAAERIHGAVGSGHRYGAQQSRADRRPG